MEIGALSGVQVDALQFALEAITCSTPLEKTIFHNHISPLLLFCRGCANEYVADPEDMLCPACFQSDFEIRQGTAMRVKTIRGS